MAKHISEHRQQQAGVSYRVTVVAKNTTLKVQKVHKNVKFETILLHKRRTISLPHECYLQSLRGVIFIYGRLFSSPFYD